MTNISSDDINSRRLQNDQKVPLIPPARIRTPSNQQQANKQNNQPFSEINPTAVNANEQLQNMKLREPSNPSLGDEMWSSVEDLFWDHMKEVQNKWSTLELNYDIWAKLIYFEQNRRLAKAYVSAPVLTIDGSANGLDGFRIGLSGIDNKYRSLSSTRCLKSIGQGVKLKIDNQGNILIRKVANSSSSRQQQQQQQQQQQVSNMHQCSIWVKDWPSSVNTNQDQHAIHSKQSENFLNENCMIRELEKSDVSYKLFDMRKFRLQLEKKRLKNDPNFIDWRQCVSIISFVRNSNNSQQKSQQKSPPNVLLEDPCWIMLINIIAIDMLKNSIICDRSSSSSTGQKMGSSNMIQQHALLGSSNGNNYNYHLRYDNKQQINNNNIDKNRSFSTIESSGKPTSSSSTSVLSPTTKSTAPTSTKHQSFSSNTSNNNNNNNSSNISKSSESSNYNNFSNSMLLDSIIQDDGDNDDDDKNNELDEENYLMLATNERIKKLRTANNRLRMSPSKSRSYYRKYQSTQQLSSLSNGNNTIYTTFNSKFINSNRSKNNLQHAHPSFIGAATQDNSSNSDHYNSVSRSTSSGNYWQPNNQPFYQLDSLKHRLHLQRNSMYRDDARLVPGQGFLTTPFEPKSISMSTFDLSLKPLDLRSSIKMNYDKVDECEDDVFFGHNNMSRKSSTLFQKNQAQHFNNETIPFKTHSRRAIISSLSDNTKSFLQEETTTESKQQNCAFPDCCCCVDELKHMTNNHHKECQSNQNKQSLDPKCTSSVISSSNNNNNDNQNDQPQKTSKPSSFDSSSSSSGCADNDYFISHSSFSMSSSTGSNERDLFSQPASSSGIACSGNTSDEYDENGGGGSQAAKRQGAKTSLLSSSKHETNGRRSLSPKNVSVDDLTTKAKKTGGLKKSNGDLTNNKSQLKRGSRIKSLGINGGYCCDSGLIETNHDSNCQKEFDCDCPSIEIADCSCCCDCFVDSAPSKLNKSSSRNALYEDESIYCKLPFPTDVSKLNTNDSVNNKTHKSDGSIARASSTTNLNNTNINRDERNLNDILTIPDANKSTKASKQTSSGGGSSWLEKRRYSKILPKFIFSSSSSSNNNRQVRNPDKNTQRKSNTLDRVEKFTLFKSTNDL